MALQLVEEIGVKEYVINRVPKIMVIPLGEDVGVYGAVAAVSKYIS